MSIGVSKAEFMDSTPSDLEPYLQAERIKLKNRDAEAWGYGYYVFMSVKVAVDTSLYGKKSKAKYFKEPLMQIAEKEKQKKKLSEEEKKKQREQLLLTLQLWQANFELNHSKGEQEK